MNVLMQMNEHADGRIGGHVAGGPGGARGGAERGATSSTAWARGRIRPGGGRRGGGTGGLRQRDRGGRPQPLRAQEPGGDEEGPRPERGGDDLCGGAGEGCQAVERALADAPDVAAVDRCRTARPRPRRGSGGGMGKPGGGPKRCFYPVAG